MTKAVDMLPWDKPDTIWASDGPAIATEFTVRGVTMKVAGTGDTAIHSGRNRYRVECVTCEEVVHPNTTGATTRCEDHLREAHGIRDVDD